MPVGMFSPSANTVNRSAFPSPSVSSRTLTRSRPLPASLRGYSRLSVIQTRPRSSKVMAIGLTMSGSLATSSTANPSGTVIASTASSGEYGRFGGRSWRWGTTSSPPEAWGVIARQAIASATAWTTCPGIVVTPIRVGLH